MFIEVIGEMDRVPASGIDARGLRVGLVRVGLQASCKYLERRRQRLEYRQASWADANGGQAAIFWRGPYCEDEFVALGSMAEVKSKTKTV